MLSEDEGEELGEKRLCWECIGEEYLKDEIAKAGVSGRCSYCDRIKRSYSVKEMADRVEAVFSSHYQRTPEGPDSMQWAMMKDDESDYSWEREGEETVYAIMNSADIPEACASDIQSLLDDKYADYDHDSGGGETEFSSDAQYEEKRPDDPFWHVLWREFEHSLKTQARFFNQSGARQLASLFEGLGELRTRDRRPMIVDGGPDTGINALHRARVFHNEEMLCRAISYPEREIGPPPSVAARAGRMNAHGISVFYGASNPHVALAEVRPPVGSQVVVARFEIVRSVRLLDLTALGSVVITGSVFDPNFGRQLARASFLASLSRRMASPVLPDDEAFSYLITQAIADFLATEAVVPLDGIIFPSVQAGATSQNVVLFHKASRVANLDLPAGTKVEASTGYGTDEGWETSFTVYEEVPEPKEPIESVLERRFPGVRIETVFKPTDPDGRKVTLKVDLKGIEVHQVKAVQFDTLADSVDRLRVKKSSGDDPF